MILCLIGGTTIGYSVLNKELKISGEIAYRVKTDIRITDFKLENVADGGLMNYSEFSTKSTMMGVNLPNPNSAVTFRVQVTNYSALEMAIASITGLDSKLTYTINGYTLKSKLCDTTNNCAQGAVKEFTITIKYAANGYDASNTSYSLRLNYLFKRFYSVTYVDFPNTTGFPTEVLANETLNVTFTAPVPGKVKVKMGATDLSSGYTLNGSSFSLPNVTDAVTITRVNKLYEAITFKNSISGSCPKEAANSDYLVVAGPETAAMYCKAKDNYGISYYFRGAAKNNYVKFGNYWWRILRVNGDNTVRLVYAGQTSKLATPLDNGQVDTATNTVISTQSAYGSRGPTQRFVGYMYGSQSTTTYATEHANTNPSALKTTLDNWYNSSGLSSYSTYLADAYFCNDRSVYNNLSSAYSTLGISKITSTTNPGSLGTGSAYADTSYGYGHHTTYYGAFYRMVVPSGANQYPTYTCYNKNDRFTVNDTTTGNGALSVPVGTLSADDLILAGANYKNDEKNSSFFLYNGTYRIWTMTPAFAIATSSSSTSNNYMGGFTMLATGWVAGASTVTTQYYVRPVINIKADVYVSSGDGSRTNAYQLTT